MENKLLIDLSLKYGFTGADVSKLANMIHQAGVTDINSRDFSKIATYICEMNLLDMPAEELQEELKRKGFIRDES